MLQKLLDARGGTIASKGTSGWFEDELLDLVRQLDPRESIAACITCAYSDYSPVGHGLFGWLACFRDAKQDYLRIRSKDPELADHVGTNPYGAELTGRQRAIVDLALTLALDSASFTDDDVDAAREAGLAEDEIWDVGAITALFAMSNRLAHLTALRPNAEFFTMGR